MSNGYNPPGLGKGAYDSMGSYYHYKTQQDMNRRLSAAQPQAEAEGSKAAAHESDRELLELAAKAIGWHPDAIIDTDNGVRKWSPLTDDGDALRLAVKLDIDVYGAGSTRFAEGDFGPHSEEAVNGDKFAATRRAIVRAAAEIGKQQVERLSTK